MLDLLFIGLLVVFFAVALLLVRLCDSVIGPEMIPAPPVSEACVSEAPESVAV